MWLVAIAIWLLCAWWGGHILYNKGRSRGWGIALGLLMGLIGVAICGLWSVNLDVAADREVEKEQARKRARARLGE